MPKKELNNSRKITKVSLVIYSALMIALGIVFITLSYTLKNMSYFWGYLLCLGPSIIFMFATVYMTTVLVLKPGASKGTIVWHCILYFLKYALIICIPIIGIWKHEIFNRWSMLSTTLIAPVLVIITKIVFANYVSKKSKK